MMWKFRMIGVLWVVVVLASLFGISTLCMWLSEQGIYGGLIIPLIVAYAIAVNWFAKKIEEMLIKSTEEPSND